MKNKLLLCLLTLILLLTVGLIFFENTSTHLISAGVIIATLSAFFLLSDSIEEDEASEEWMHSIFFPLNVDLRHKETMYYAFAVVILSAVVGIVNLFFFMDKVDFSSVQSDFNIKRTILFSNTISVVLVQIGGFFLQAFLTTILINIVGGTSTFENVLKITGLSYFGFLLSAMISFLYNFFALPDSLMLEDLQNAMTGNFELKLIGKSFEYYSLLLLTYGIVKLENFSVRKALFIAFTPGLLLMIMKLIYQYIFNA